MRLLSQVLAFFVAAAQLQASPTSFSLYQRQTNTSDCKVFPGDANWPDKTTWDSLNQTVGGNLLKPVPIAAVCHKSYPEHYNAERCQELLTGWASWDLRVSHPTSTFYPYFLGFSCAPTTDPSSPCLVGGAPEYVVNLTYPNENKQIAATIKFAREKNVRLIIKNSGHDVSGKSTGAGSLSIWTHNLKKLEYISEYKDPDGYYSGPAVRAGAGVDLEEYYKIAKDNGVTVVGGECATVGVAGGYLSGGGHSPIGGIFGMGADQVVALTAVLPNGTEVSITNKTQPDLFWAFRGGGGSTFGVVTSVTVKAFPKIPITVSKWSWTTGGNVSNETFWKAVGVYFENVPIIAEAGTQAFPSIQSITQDDGKGGYKFNMTSHVVPNLTIAQYEEFMKPLFLRWETLGIYVHRNSTYHEDWWGGWQHAFPKTISGPYPVRVTVTGSRLFPRQNFEDAKLRARTLQAFREVSELGVGMIFYTQRNRAPAGIAENAINPAYRPSYMFLITSGVHPVNATQDQVNTVHNTVTNIIVPKFKAVTPGGGTYMNEADSREKDWQQSFFGSNYPRLLQLKKELDPYGVLFAPKAVGSEMWEVRNTDGWGEEVQTGRLCRSR